MRVFLGGASLGLATGLLLGWLFFSSPPPRAGSTETASAAPTAGETGAATAATGPTPFGHLPPRAGARPADAPTEEAPLDYAEAERRIEALRAELAEVGAEADEARETLAKIREADEKAKARLPFPEDLPERFTQEQLMSSVGEALDKIGGEITAVDCTEYPCIVYADLPGHGVPPPVEFKGLMEDPAMAAYAGDSRMNFAYDDTDEAGNHLARHTGFAFFPKASGSKAASEEIGEHVHRRVREWRKATAPPEDPAN